MAYLQYQIQGNHTTGLTAKHYHGESISTLNDYAKNNIPANAKISSIQVFFNGKLSTGDTKFYVGLTNSSDTEPGHKIISDELKTSAPTDGWWGWFPVFNSSYPFAINTDYSRVNVWMSSGIVMKKFTCIDFSVYWFYDIPTYTVTVNAGTGGTVSGGGIFENGTTTTITATANKGYTFKNWNDGNTDASRSVTVRGNVTYTAEFVPKQYTVSFECQASESGEMCTVSGAGTYKYGDTVALIAADVPSNHKIRGWGYITNNITTESGYLGIGDEGSILRVTLDEESLRGFNAELTTHINFAVYLEHTGFRLQVDVTPSEGGTAEYGCYDDTGYKRIYGIPSGSSIRVAFAESMNAAIKVILKTGFRFLRWTDGNTDNPRSILLDEDSYYNAEVEKLKFTVIYRNDDGTVLQEMVVEYGEKQPPYTGTAPTKESTEKYDYIFLGWDALNTTIMRDEVFTAVYQENLRTYIIAGAAEEGGTVSGGGTFTYGSTATLEAVAYDGYEFLRWSDGVTTPTRKITVADNATYTAIFRINWLLGNLSEVDKLKFNLDEVEGLLLNHTKIYEKGN